MPTIVGRGVAQDVSLGELALKSAHQPSNGMGGAPRLALRHQLEIDFAPYRLGILLKRGQRGSMLTGGLKARHSAFGRSHA